MVSIPMSSGATDLHLLLSSMQPQMQAGEFVFCCAKDGIVPDGFKPLGAFREAEGMTLIIERSQADQRQLRYEGCYRMITLGVHSSLQAVGFLAAIASALAEEGIPCNAISAYYHDHLFIPLDYADKAMRGLMLLARANQ